MTKETKVRTSRIGTVAAVLSAALAIAACGSSSSSTGAPAPGASGGSAGSGGSSGGAPATLNGAGSTLAAPIYQQWGSTLKNQGLTVNFNPVGSGAGVADLQTGTVQFAGSDPALKTSDTAKMKGPTLQFPVAFGGITVSYNLSGITSGLKLDGPTIADIFLGKIKSWNDPAIAQLNPGMKLPNSSITVVHRSDSSGTTKGFTTFLEDDSPQWKSQVGADKDVKWPTGTGAAKNSGVAAAIKQTQGAIGYVEQAYALLNNFTYAAVKNSHGRYILPTIANTSTAATGISIPKDLGISTINAGGPSAYPIVSQTFLDTYQDPCKAAGASASTASGIKRFLGYAFGAGQQTLGSGGSKLPYAPLPSSLAAKDQSQLGTMTCNGKPIS
jgi:phosphate transport system substrate-binding protein